MPRRNVATSITGEDGNEPKIVRENMPFGTIGKGEFGTFLIPSTTFLGAAGPAARSSAMAKPA
jgi:hypothetical protein